MACAIPRFAGKYSGRRHFTTGHPQRDPEPVDAIRIITAKETTKTEGNRCEQRNGGSYSLGNLPDPSPERLAELRRLDKMPDDQINYDDIPVLTEAQLAEMKRAMLPAYQEVDHDPHRRGCAGVAEGGWARLPFTHEHHPAAGNAELEMIQLPDDPDRTCRRVLSPSPPRRHGSRRCSGHLENQ